MLSVHRVFLRKEKDREEQREYEAEVRWKEPASMWWDFSAVRSEEGVC
jgi:hypothetical protein